MGGQQDVDEHGAEIEIDENQYDFCLPLASDDIKRSATTKYPVMKQPNLLTTTKGTVHDLAVQVQTYANGVFEVAERVQRDAVEVEIVTEVIKPMLTFMRDRAADLAKSYPVASAVAYLSDMFADEIQNDQEEAETLVHNAGGVEIIALETSLAAGTIAHFTDDSLAGAGEEQKICDNDDQIEQSTSLKI